MTDDNVWLEFNETFNRHLLGSRVVEEGQEVEVQLLDESWVRGVFHQRPGTRRRANLWVPMAGSIHRSVLQLPDMGVLARWPEASQAA